MEVRKGRREKKVLRGVRRRELVRKGRKEMVRERRRRRGTRGVRKGRKEMVRDGRREERKAAMEGRIKK